MLKNMTLKSMVMQIQAESSDLLAVDASILFLFSFSQCLCLMVLKASMAMRTEVQESQEHGDLDGPACSGRLP